MTEGCYNCAYCCSGSGYRLVCERFSYPIGVRENDCCEYYESE